MVNSLSQKYLIIVSFLAVNRTTILFIKHFFHSKIENKQPNLHFDRNILFTTHHLSSTTSTTTFRPEHSHHTHTSTQHYLIYYISTIYAIEVLRSPNGSTHDRPPKPPTESNTFLLSYILFTLVLYFTYGSRFMNIAI